MQGWSAGAFDWSGYASTAQRFSPIYAYVLFIMDFFRLFCRAIIFLDGFPKPRSPPTSHQVDAAQQQRHFLMTEYDFGLPRLGRRPTVAPPFQPLCAYPKPTAIPENELQPIPLRIRKQEDVPA
jgi:hypothetical protein